TRPPRRYETHSRGQTSPSQLRADRPTRPRGCVHRHTSAPSTMDPVPRLALITPTHRLAGFRRSHYTNASVSGFPPLSLPGRLSPGPARRTLWSSRPPGGNLSPRSKKACGFGQVLSVLRSKVYPLWTLAG